MSNERRQHDSHPPSGRNDGDTRALRAGNDGAQVDAWQGSIDARRRQ